MRRPLEILLATHHRGEVSGVERDWINAANALGPERARLTWAGIEGTDALRDHVDRRVLAATLEFKFPLFSYLVHEEQYAPRSVWRWARIVIDHLRRSIEPARGLARALRSAPFDLVVSGTSVITAGALAARRRRIPHAWAVKEWLDPSRPACRRYARVIGSLSEAVIAPSLAVAEVFEGAAVVVPDGSAQDRLPSARTATERAQLLSPARAVAGVPPSSFSVDSDLVEGPARDAGSSGAARTHNGPAAVLRAVPWRWQPRMDGEPTLDGLPVSPQVGASIVCFQRVAPGDLGLMNAADVLVHPSVLPDPSPNAVREGMLLGKAIVASGGGGIVELLEDGVSGLLVNPGDAPAVARAISRLLTDESSEHASVARAQAPERGAASRAWLRAAALEEVLRAAASRSIRTQRARARTT